VNQKETNPMELALSDHERTIALANSSEAELTWDEQWRADRAGKEIENRKWLKDFALLLALILVTITVATVLAGLGASAK